MEYGVIMAGGSGTRLWPLSRGDTPKQLLPVVKGKSLLQLSYERLRGMLPAERIFVCTGAAHRDAVLANLPELPPENLLGEPVGRDTANAVGFPAAVLLAARQGRRDGRRHRRPRHRAGRQISRTPLRTAFDVVARTPRIAGHLRHRPHARPHRPGLHPPRRAAALESAAGAYRVQAFKEKPDKPTADRYVESGRYYWNSGMFVWRCDTVLGELQAASARRLRRPDARSPRPGTRRSSEAVLNEVYPTLPKISIDYAVMEPAAQAKGKAHVVVVEMPVQWLDVGSWPALAETLDTDEHDNAIDCDDAACSSTPTTTSSSATTPTTSSPPSASAT